MVLEIITKFEEWIANNSVYRFDRIVHTVLHRDATKPIRGGTWIELPTWIKNKKCCINI